MMSQSTLMEVELYRFSSPGVEFLYTSHEFDVETMGHGDYRSLPIERNALALGAEAAKSALELRLPPDCDLVRHLLDAAITGAGTSVLLQYVVRIEGFAFWSHIATRWMGRVLGIEVSGDAARLHCESVQVSLKRIGLRRLYSRNCSHVLYSAACGALPLAAPAVVTGSDGRTLYLDGGTPPEVSGALAGGWLATAAGQRYMIVADHGYAIEMLTPVAIEPGSVVTLVAGCDHSTDVCDARFDNLDNYGGFPFIPGKNPFGTGVF